MLNINEVRLSGNVVRIESKGKVDGEQKLVVVTIANNRIFKTQDGEEKKDTIFMDINLWGDRGNYTKENIKQGDLVYIEGKLKENKWEKDGEKRSRILITGDRLQYVSSPPKRETNNEENEKDWS